MDSIDNPLHNAPHTLDDIIDEWNRSYSRELAAYPVEAVMRNKFWPTVNRIDDVYGSIWSAVVQTWILSRFWQYQTSKKRLSGRCLSCLHCIIRAYANPLSIYLEYRDNDFKYHHEFGAQPLLENSR